VKQASASNVEPLVRCGASHVLPQHDTYAERTEKGTDGHALLADAINKVPGSAAKLSASYPGLGFHLAERFHGVENVQCEAAYVVDVKKRSSVFLGLDIGRAYELRLKRPLGEFELGVSLDVGGMKDGVHWVRDFKFGRYSSWWQLYVQAMAVLWAPGQETGLEVDAGFIHIESDDEETRVWDDTATLYLVDLDDHADSIAEALARAHAMDLVEDKSILPTKEGKWCEYCGAYPHCPAKWKLAKSLIGLDAGIDVGCMTTEQCGEAWLSIKQFERRVLEKTKDNIKQRLRVEGAFPLSSGKKLRLVSMPGRNSLDRPATLAMLRAKGASAEELAGLVLTGNPYEMVKEVK
jgi:hypothetical protein